MTDLYLNNIENEYFDIEIGENGDFELTDGLDTALKLSIFEEKRDISIDIQSKRGGWWGNELRQDFYELGSYIWTKYQSKISQSILNIINGFLYDCLQWIINDKIAKNIDINTSIYNNSIYSNINILRNNNMTDSFYIQLFTETKQ